MNTKPLTLLAIAVVLMIAGCKKEETDSTPGPSPTPSPSNSAFRSWFAQHVEDAAQLFNINASVGGEVEGTDGVTLIFEPGAFLHADGTTVTGAVEVSLVEALTIGDMIWLNKQTVGNDNGTLRMLRSGGEVRVLATQAGEQLRLVEDGMLALIPAASPDPAMGLFSGAEDEAGRMVWSPIDSSSVTSDPDSVGFNYAFYSDSLQWINCDYFYDYPSTTWVAATLPAGQTQDSTCFWIAFPTENAVMCMSYNTGQSYNSWQVAPVGMSAVIVGLHRNGTSYFSSFTSVVITSGVTVPTTFSPTTPEQFEADLNAL